MSSANDNTTTSSDVIAKAQDMVGKLFRGKQDGWPDGMFIMVTVGQIKDILSVLGSDITSDANAVGARKKDI